MEFIVVTFTYIVLFVTFPSLALLVLDRAPSFEIDRKPMQHKHLTCCPITGYMTVEKIPPCFQTLNVAVVDLPQQSFDAIPVL